MAVILRIPKTAYVNIDIMIDSKNNTRKTGFWQGRFLHFVLIVLVGLLAYSNTFNAPFYFDDANVIGASPVVKNLDYFLHPSKVADVYTPYKDNIKILMNSRYVGYLTLALNYKVGGLNVRGYHIVNIATHFINGMLLYFIVIWLFRTPKLFADTTAKLSAWVALFASLLFVVHPIQTQAVTYIVQRFTSLATLFYLSAIFCYLKARVSKQNLFLVLSLISTILALNTKEIAYTIPLTVALIEWLFFDGSTKEKAKTVAPYFILTAFVGVWMFGGGVGTGSKLSLKAQTDISRMDYLYTEATVLVRYLRLIVYPVGLTFDYDWPLYNTLFNYNVMASAGLLLSLFIAGVWSMKRTGLRLVSFGIFWFFIAHIVESGAIPIADVIFEHRMYLPSAGLFIAFAGLVVYLYEKGHGRVVIKALSVLILVGLISATIARNGMWRDEIAFWKDNLKNSPNKPRVHLQLAKAYMRHNMLEEAVVEYENVLQRDPDSFDALTNIGMIYIDIGLNDRAEDRLQRAIAIKPDSSEGYGNLGNIRFNRQEYDKALELYLMALSVDKDSVTSLYNIASTYAKLKEYDKAKEYFKRAISIDPTYCPAHQNYGALLMSVGELDGAIAEFKTAIKINHDDLIAHTNLIFIYIGRGDLSNALVELEEVVRLNPGDSISRMEIESIKSKTKDKP